MTLCVFGLNQSYTCLNDDLRYEIHVSNDENDVNDDFVYWNSDLADLMMLKKWLT